MYELTLEQLTQISGGVIETEVVVNDTKPTGSADGATDGGGEDTDTGPGT